MAQFVLNGGVDETEPTLIADNAMQDADGAEYRVGQNGIYVARGRDLVGTISGVTGVGLYEAGFDGSMGTLIAHVGNSYFAAQIASTLTFGLIDNLPTGTSAIVGTHYANRHYTANGMCNKRIEDTGGITTFPIGMSATTFAIGVSVTQGVSTMTASTGLEYWVTEYDATRGIESIFGTTANTGTFTSKDGVVVTVTGVSANPRASTLRWYRSVDGGGYPDGGLIQETAIGTTSITDRNYVIATLTVPLYGIVSIGGLDVDRDEAPPVFSTIFGPYQDSLLAAADSDPRSLRFTPAGYPDSWPSAYAIPFETPRQDSIITGVVLAGRIGIFCNDSVHVVFRLPRDSDSIFAAGEMQDTLTDARGCVSRRGATVFTPPGTGSLAAFVARDGIWITDLTSSPAPVTDKIDWEGRVSIAHLPTCRLLDDPINRRLVFLHRKATDTTYSTGVWYLDYQQFQNAGFRVTFADHGPLADGVTIAGTDGKRRVASIDSRSGNGQVYTEGSQDADDSQLRDSSGSVRFRIRTKEIMPVGPEDMTTLGTAIWMHDAGPARIEHRFYFNRRDSNPEIKPMPDTTIRNGSDVQLQRNVNSFSLEIESAGTISYGVHWVDIEPLDKGPIGSRTGA